ncbi:SIS domain-containing protein [Variovorax sp. PBL-E5]|uniref:SIS domain-containing protein n=1 Tax=Variovorax sp. PBL-E5 TaxID=434014 RepID=UPI001319456C|nr:hypothetical protein [Variovorax sp. PBL-E5]VTU30200.1 Glutamine--fructose-6-phosphate aminotransferase [isomerizing] [Variovorax sp. PBL-E5]
MNPDDPSEPQALDSLTSERLVKDTLAIPRGVRALYPSLVQAVERALSACDAGAIESIHLSGSGDLLHSAMAVEIAFQRLTGIRTWAMPSMRFGLYAARDLSARSVVIQMSFSGKTARAVEAATMAGLAGARVWALTSDAQSPLAQLAERCILKPDTGGNEAAGYPITMLLLYLVAVRVAELRGRLGAAQADALRGRLARSADSMEQTLAQCIEPARALAHEFIGAEHALFLGTGPTYGSAVNGSARILEAVGINASAQDIEEWAHLDRWVEECSSPRLVIAPDGPGVERAGEILAAMQTLGKPSVAIVADHAVELGSQARAWLPVHCELPEEFSPLVYGLPGELFAHLLGAARKSRPYRHGHPAYERLGEIRWGGCIRRSLPAWDPEGPSRAAVPSQP